MKDFLGRLYFRNKVTFVVGTLAMLPFLLLVPKENRPTQLVPWRRDEKGRFV